MNLRNIYPGDVVRCNVKGRQFDATVMFNAAGTLHINPPANVTYYRVTSRQVVKVVQRAARLRQVVQS